MASIIHWQERASEAARRRAAGESVADIARSLRVKPNWVYRVLGEMRPKGGRPPGPMGPLEVFICPTCHHHIVSKPCRACEAKRARVLRKPRECDPGIYGLTDDELARLNEIRKRHARPAITREEILIIEMTEEYEED